MDNNYVIIIEFVEILLFLEASMCRSQKMAYILTSLFENIEEKQNFEIARIENSEKAQNLNLCSLNYQLPPPVYKHTEIWR